MVPLYVSLAALSCLSFAGAGPLHPLPRSPLHLPLVTKRGPISVEVYGFFADALRNKYGYPYSSLSKRQDIPLEREPNGDHLVEITIGTEPQPLRVVPDTGSVDLWVTSASFDRTASTTLEDVTDPDRATVSHIYRPGTASGDVVRDTVRFGDYAVEDQRFLLADDITTPPASPNSGVIGLPAPDTTPASSAFAGAPFWASVRANVDEVDHTIGFKFPPPGGSREAREVLPGGTLTLGGKNESLFTGDIEYNPLVYVENHASKWLLNVAGITVGGENVALPPNGVASIETGTPLIGGPTDAVSAIYAKVPGSKPLDGDLAGFFGFPCNSKVEVTISFGGKFWPIDPREINLGPVPSDPALCVGAIFDLNGGSNHEDKPNWVIGVAFLRGVYSVFCSEPPAVGFAQLA